MTIQLLTHDEIESAAHLVAEFRVALKSYKGISASPNADDGKQELLEYMNAAYPVYVAQVDDVYVGYMVCRVEEPCVWVESLYVRDAYRRRNIASALFAKAEELAAQRGEETVFNYVHPNNDGMIAFLRARGYTVLNLIEIRKPYAGERLTTKIRVGRQEFDY